EPVSLPRAPPAPAATDHATAEPGAPPAPRAVPDRLRPARPWPPAGPAARPLAPHGGAPKCPDTRYRYHTPHRVAPAPEPRACLSPLPASLCTQHSSDCLYSLSLWERAGVRGSPDAFVANPIPRLPDPHP